MFLNQLEQIQLLYTECSNNRSNALNKNKELIFTAPYLLFILNLKKELLMKHTPLLATTFSLFSGGAFAAQTPSVPLTDRPNIVWLLAEDMGPDLECFGMPGVKTPNLNRLAAEGAIFSRAYCAGPICSPNRSSMMTGVHQTEINAQHHRSNRDVPLPAPYKPTTYWLRKAGYTCTLGNPNVFSLGTKIDCNFKHKPVGPYNGVSQFGLFDKKYGMDPADQPFFNQTTLMTTHRGDWWNDIRKQSLHPVSPADIKLPPYFADTPKIRLDWATYLDQVEYMDKEVGMIIQELKDSGIDQNTVIIFIADNGRCNLRGKGYLYDPGIHVPMIVWAPGRIQPGTVIDDLVCTTDISATILQLAGAEIPDYITAKPFLGTEHPHYRDYIRSARDIWDEIDECSRSIITKKYAYIRNYMPEVPWATDQAYLELNRPALWIMRKLKAEGKLSKSEMVFFKNHKPVEELYDLENDPHQLHNLANNPEYAEVLGEMRVKETEWHSNHKDFGLEDLGTRTPEQDLIAGKAREWVKKEHPDWWQQLKSGNLMATHAWFKEIRSK